MLVSLCPKPVYYASAASCQQQYNESGAVSKRPLPPHQNNPTASDRGAKEGGKNLMGRRGKKKREGETQRDMQIKLQPKITFNSAEKCKTLGLLSANVQDEVQTIYFIFIYFKTDAVALYFIIQDFQRRQTEFLQPN